jgi:cyclopropane fatty-acyl-phospholipid synthase-like methyltransferase
MEEESEEELEGDELYKKLFNDTLGTGNRYKAMADFEFTKKQAIDWVGGNLISLPTAVINYLRSHGLTKEKRFLDIGCGPLRCSKAIIDHLNPSNYFGMDGDSNLLNVARQSLTKKELSKTPTLKSSWNFEFHLFGQPSFDIILAQGVICHMPNDEIVKMFSKIKEFLSEEGCAHISYIPGIVKDSFNGVFQQTFEELKQLGASVGLQVFDEGEWGHPRNLLMISLTH